VLCGSCRLQEGVRGASPEGELLDFWLLGLCDDAKARLLMQLNRAIAHRERSEPMKTIGMTILAVTILLAPGLAPAYPAAAQAPGAATQTDSGSDREGELNSIAYLPMVRWDPRPGVMVPVPSGEFTMGSSTGFDHERPVHTVYLDAYAIDLYEVTNTGYAGFLNARGNQQEGGSTWLDADDTGVRIHQVGGVWQADAGYGDHPVVSVTWYGARAYCTWVGKRLPSEAEWEKAARGTDARTYPWGNQAPDCSLANYYSGCVDDTSPVGSYPSGASPYGALDMAGNVWEWVNDWYSSDYYGVSPYRNPRGPASGSFKVLRGGSWIGVVDQVRAAYRSGWYLVPSCEYFGFRCAGSIGD
jgi:formylglycine-generating enzyme required for sulfatase activity